MAIFERILFRNFDVIDVINLYPSNNLLFTYSYCKLRSDAGCEMRIIEILWLLTACLGMSVLSQVGNETLSPECNCSAENFSEFFYQGRYNFFLKSVVLLF